MSSDTYRVSVDVGGTFMDLVLLNERTGETRVEKIASLPDQLHKQFVRGLTSFDVPIDNIDRLFHGMTVGVNALVQERGAKVGLITTQGFRDVLEMGRGGRKPVYDFVKRSAAPIVARRLRREVAERVTHGGEVVIPLDLDQVVAEADFLLAAGVEAISIVFLHSYAYPDHEQQARDAIKRKYPDLFVSISCEVAAEWREFERSSTTVLNSFIQPTVANYIAKLEEELHGIGLTRPIAIMQSNGGAADTGAAKARPIRTLMSGPAGGVIGAKFLADRLGHANVICTDVGGTTYDVAIIEGGKILERTQTHINERPILGSMIDVISIGAGGGSIAWLDHRNGLQVGPQSAGASPGPVSFGQGGTEPTVTDANLIMGRLDPDYFLGGRMRLDMDAAKAILQSKIADPLGLGLIAAADGIVKIAETNMANAIRTKTVERGLDPREFVLMAFGGGGGLFACSVAAELGVAKVIVPIAPANFSAWGILTADYSEDRVRTKVIPFGAATFAQAAQVADDLFAEAAADIRRYGFADEEIVRTRIFDLRFQRQEYTIQITLPADLDGGDAAEAFVRQAFVDEHRRLYGHGDIAVPLEIVAIRARATGAVQPPEIAPPSNDEGAPERTRLIHFDGSDRPLQTRVVHRANLKPGDEVTGPAIIDEWTMTTIVLPTWRAEIDALGNIVLSSK